MIGRFSDISILVRGGATGRTNLINRIKVVFPGVRRLGELVTLNEAIKRVVPSHHEAQLLLPGSAGQREFNEVKR